LSKHRKKYYLVVSQINNHTYGAFNLTPHGLTQAEKYIITISKVYKSDKFTIEEK